MLKSRTKTCTGGISRSDWMRVWFELEFEFEMLDDGPDSGQCGSPQYRNPKRLRHLNDLWCFSDVLLFLMSLPPLACL